MNRLLLNSIVSVFIAGFVYVLISNIAPESSLLRGGETNTVSIIDNASTQDNLPANEDLVAQESGADGSDGSNGADGNNGSIGSDGSNGDSGQNGVDGQRGSGGENGSNGQNGRSGENGQSGVNGFDGTAGNDGQSGTQGPQGDQGLTGQQGDQATDDQTLSYANETQTLSVSGGNSISLSSLLDNTDTLGSLTCANQQVAKYVSGDWVCAADNDENVADDSVDYAQLADTLTLDTDTTTSLGSFDQVLNMTGSGNFLIQDGGVTVMSVLNNGTFNFRNSTNSTEGFVVSNSAGNSLLTIDSVNSRLYVGNPTADNTGSLLVLDNKTTAGDPTGLNGGSYYNSSSNKFRCFENGSWRDCIKTARSSYEYYNDFMGATSDGRLTFAVTGTGSSNSVTLINSVPNHPGVLAQYTGTTATGNARAISTAVNGILLGNGSSWQSEAVVRVPILSDATNRFIYRSGFMDAAPGVSVDGCLLTYSDTINSGNWQALCRSNNAETICNTGVPVVAGIWYKLRIDINDAATVANFSINGAASSCQVTSNIPSAAGRGTAFGTVVLKSVGAATRSVETDYLEIRGQFSTIR